MAKRWERSVFHPALAMKGVVPKDILEFGTLRPGRSFHEGGSYASQSPGGSHPEMNRRSVSFTFPGLRERDKQR